jgi:hypothetical protein
MTEVWLVASGGYELDPLAVFDDEDAARAWADVWNLANLGRVSDDTKAVVHSKIPHNPAGIR